MKTSSTKIKLFFIAILLVFNGALSGCAEDIQATNSAATDTSSSVDGASNPESPDKDGPIQVNASDKEDWIYFDLDSGDYVSPEDASDDSQWDLGFQRFKIKSNGGVSGTGGVEVAPVEGADYESLSAAPVAEYFSDAEDSEEDSDSDPDYAFLAPVMWYNYDVVEHTLSPADVVYVLRSTEGSYFKIQMLGYYDDAGTSGFPSFQFAAVESPDPNEVPEEKPEEKPQGQVTVEPAADGGWSYLNVLSGEPVEIEDPADSTDWDIAVQGTMIQTNSGSSGSGMGGAIALEEGSWDETTSSPTVGFEMDTTLPMPGPPGSGDFSGNPVLNDWYDYDMETHTASPKDMVFLIRTATGKYGKLKILDYSKGTMELHMAPVTRSPEVHSTSFEASEDFAYLNFHAGALVTPEDPANSEEWDLAVNGMQIQTNSGTSGPGMGGALDPEKSTLEEVLSFPSASGCYLISGGHVCDCAMSTEECDENAGIWTDQCQCEAPYVIDEILEGGESGNSLLTQWMEADSGADEPVAKAMAFIVRTALGEAAKIQVKSYENGTLTIDWSYAGPGHTSF